MHSSLNLVAVGDLQLGDSPTSIGYGFYSRYRGGSIDPLFDDLKASLAAADIVFGNLETTLVPPERGDSQRRNLQLRGEPAFAASLRRVGFTVLNVANNHANQHGDEAFCATVAELRQAGIACCGVRGKTPWASEPVLLHGGAVGVLGYCLRPRQYNAAIPPFAEGDRVAICADVSRLRGSGAQVLVSLHWGEEFVPTPSAEEMSLGRSIIDAGATVVLGHHPHVARPVERYKSGVIAYSLGNFIGDMVWYAPFLRGSLLRCGLADHAAIDPMVTPTHLDADYRPTLDLAASEAPAAEGGVRGLDGNEYAVAIRRTMADQRRASYRSALLNLRRTPLPILIQLVTQTLRNKIAAANRRTST